MLDKFQELADPYTQWILANRNLVIVLLAFALLIESLGLMIARWRLEKVSGDLAEARQAPPPATRPTYAMPRPPAPTDLPPVRGGMTYARNLGGALDRAYGSPPPGPPPPAPPPPPYRDQRPSVAWPEPPGSPYIPGPPPPVTLAPPVPAPLPGPPPVYPPVVMTPPPAAVPHTPSGATYYPPPAAPPPLAPPIAPAPVASGLPPPLVPPIVKAEPAAPSPEQTTVPAAERLKRWVPKLRGRPRPAEAPSPPAPAPTAPGSVTEHSLPPVAAPSGPPPVAASQPTPAPVVTSQPAPAPAPVAAPADAVRSWLRREEVTAEASPDATSSAVAGGATAARPTEREAAAPEPAARTAQVHASPEPPAPPPAARVEEASEDEEAPPPAETEPDSTNAQRVLLIEDDESVARYYSMLFEARGYQVSIATDGVQGVDMATRLQPGLILLDVMMPRQNGMMVLQTLHATPATEDTPIVILSNFTEPTLIQRALQLGAIEYVVKTQVKAEALANAVPKWMKRERAFA